MPGPWRIPPHPERYRVTPPCYGTMTGPPCGVGFVVVLARARVVASKNPRSGRASTRHGARLEGDPVAVQGDARGDVARVWWPV